jgi:hypothetical protein
MQLRRGAEGLLESYEPYDHGQPVVHWLAQSLSLLNPLVLGPDESARTVFVGSETLKELCRERAGKFYETRLGLLKTKLASADPFLQKAFFDKCRSETAWWDSPTAKAASARRAQSRARTRKPKANVKRARR